VCDPAKNTAFPAGFTKYRVFTVLCFSGPIDVFVVLETVTVTAGLVPILALGSCATAVNVWVPFESAVVSSEVE
jgi:hypothetical protein